MLIDAVDRISLARFADMAGEGAAMSWAKSKSMFTVNKCEDEHAYTTFIEELHPNLTLVQCNTCKKWLLNLTLPARRA